MLIPSRPCGESHDTLEFPPEWTGRRKVTAWANSFCQSLIAFIGRAWHLLIPDYDDALTSATGCLQGIY